MTTAALGQGTSNSQSAARTALARSLMGAAKPSSALWGGTGDSPRVVRLFGLAIDNTRLAQASRDVVQAAVDRKRMRIVFANAHVVNTALTDAGYLASVQSADRIYADGSGMALAAKINGKALIDNVNGTDMFALLCADCVAAGQTIFLLGGKPGVAGRAAQTIADFGMGAAIAGTHHGYFTRGSADEDRVIGQINASGAGIVLVGFGVPEQDRWTLTNAARLDAPVVAGVGGLFDFFAGEVARSPKFMRTVGCEWVWRLAMEPRRMAKRYLIGNAVFIGHALREAWTTRPMREPDTGRRAPEAARATSSQR